jgi:hypothetical protein
LASYDQPAIATLEPTNGWVPGRLVHGVDAPLPPTGVLWLFVNRRWQASSEVRKRAREGLVRVLHRPDATGVELRASPVAEDPSGAYPATLDKALSLPAPHSPHLAVDRLAGDYYALFEDFLRVVQGGPEPTRLLGHVGVSDHAKLSKKVDVQLFQVRGEWIGADGFDLLHFLIADDDLRAQAWDRVRFETMLG